MSDYRIGQVIYVVLKKDSQVFVFPVQVIEVVNKTTREGTHVSYVVNAKFTDGDRRVQLSDLAGEVFDTSDKVRKVLTERAVAKVTKMVDGAVARSRELYGDGFEATGTPVVELAPKQDGKRRAGEEVLQLAAELANEAKEQEGAVIQLPDGTTARVRSVTASPPRQA